VGATQGLLVLLAVASLRQKWWWPGLRESEQQGTFADKTRDVPGEPGWGRPTR
jgi:hypothetical protein